MANIELKYRLRDFYKINNAFLQIYLDSQEGDYDEWLKAMQTLLEYPKEVLETFLQSILALDEQYLTKEKIDAAKMYILLRMNLCTIKDK